MDRLNPQSPEELAEALATAASAGHTIRLGGAFSKDRMAGPVAPAGVTISTSAMTRVLQYEPRDLTISVEAGLPFAQLHRILAENRQMVPLDPPYHEQATVGGVLAANLSGPRRRLYGTARDLVIGMQFATLEGKLVQSGGMVVKNVAGLDMGKLLIGSFGTLAALAVVNFKLLPMPAFSRSFLFSFETLAASLVRWDGILKSVLQPAAIDLLNPAAAARIGRQGWLLALRAGGNAAVLERYSTEWKDAQPFEGDEEAQFWSQVQEFTPRFLAEHEGGAVARASFPLRRLAATMESFSVPAVARAGNGVCYAHFPSQDGAAEWAARSASGDVRAVVEYRAAQGSSSGAQWPAPGPDFAMMEKVKDMFDPKRLLNPGRMYGRI